MSGMSSELMKVARNRKRDLELQDRREQLGGTLVAMGGPRATRGAGMALGHAAITGGESLSDPKLTKKMLRGSGHKAFAGPKDSGFDAHAMPKGFMPKFIRKHIEQAAKSEKDPVKRQQMQRVVKQLREGVYLKGRAAHAPTIAAHELGHMDIGASRAGRLLQNLPTALALRLSPAAGLASGVVSGLKSDKEDEGAARKAMIAPAAAAAPGLGYEGLAHAKGIKHLRRAGMKPGQIAKQMLRSNLPAYLTYATLPAAGAASAYGSTKAIQAWRRRQARKEE
jgi:hypothetical protein